MNHQACVGNLFLYIPQEWKPLYVCDVDFLVLELNYFYPIGDILYQAPTYKDGVKSDENNVKQWKFLSSY